MTTRRSVASVLEPLAHYWQLLGPMAENGLPKSFYNPLKRESRGTYKTREQAGQDIFDDIKIFYNPKRKHVRNGMLSPADYENGQRNINQVCA